MFREDKLLKLKRLIRDQIISSDEIIAKIAKIESMMKSQPDLFTTQDSNWILNLLDSAIIHSSNDDREDRTKLVLFLAEKQKDLNIIHPRYNSILYNAAQYGNKEIVEYLIKNGADINFKNNDGETLLHAAARNPSITDFKEITEILMKAGLDINIPNNHGVNPSVYYQQVLDNKRERTESLMSQINVKYRDRYFCREALLDYAIRSRDPETLERIKFFISYGADINSVDYYQRTLLYNAIISRDLETAKYLITQGVKLDVKTSSGRTLLHTAVLGNYTINSFEEIAKILMDAGVDINAKDNENKTALHYSVLSNKNKKVTEFLIKSGADVNIQDNENKTILHYYAALKYNIFGDDGNIIFGDNISYAEKRQIKLLVAHGLDINAEDKEGKTPLYHAIINNNNDRDNYYKQKIELLIKCGADINIAATDGSTPIKMAVKGEDQEVILVLIKKWIEDFKKNNPNKTPAETLEEVTTFFKENQINFDIKKDKIGDRTLLYHAAKEEYKDIVEILIGAFIKISEKDRQNMSFFQKIKEFFVPNKATLDIQDSRGNTLLYYAVESGNIKMAELLIKNGAKLNIKDKTSLFGSQFLQGKTPLHYAAKNGDIKMAELLIKNGAKLNIKDNLGRTPLYYATQKSKEIEKFFKEAEEIAKKENNIFGKIWAKTEGIIKSAISSFKEKLSSKTSVKTDNNIPNADQTPRSSSKVLAQNP